VPAQTYGTPRYCNAIGTTPLWGAVESPSEKAGEERRAAGPPNSIGTTRGTGVRIL